MKSWIFITFAFVMAFPTMASAQRNRVPEPGEVGEPVQVTDFTSESEPSDGAIYILDDNHYVASSKESLFANLNLESKDVYQTRWNMADNPIPPNQAIIEYVRNRLPEKYRNFTAVATVFLNRKKRRQ